VGKLTRLILPAALLLAGYYAVFGGEHTLMDVRRTRSARAAEAVELERLRAVNDSLEALVDSLQTDPVLLERLARERFGMIRDGEVLYRFAPGDSGAADAADPDAR
jgi:cell division protein FtsB